MLKDMINAIPTSRAMNSGRNHHLCGPNPCVAFQDMHSGLDPTLMLIPDLVHSSHLVSSMTIGFLV